LVPLYAFNITFTMPVRLSFTAPAMLPLALFVLLACAPPLAPAVKVPLSKAHSDSRGGHGHAIKTPWHLWERQHPVDQHLVLGMRVPRRYFVCKGASLLDRQLSAWR